MTHYYVSGSMQLLCCFFFLLLNYSSIVYLENHLSFVLFVENYFGYLGSFIVASDAF